MAKMATDNLPLTRVRIPYLNSAEHHRPIQEAVMRAAESAGITPLQMALHMNHFLEQVPEQMISGRVVRVP